MYFGQGIPMELSTDSQGSCLWNDHFWFQERPLFIWISKKIGDSVNNSIFNISWRWMAQSFVLVDRSCWFQVWVVFSLSRWRIQGGVLGGGGEGGTRERRWYLGNLSHLGCCSGMALQTLEPPGHWRWEGVYSEMLGVPRLPGWRVHPLKQCLNQVEGAVPARSMATTCWVQGARNSTMGAMGTILARQWFPPGTKFWSQALLDVWDWQSYVTCLGPNCKGSWEKRVSGFTRKGRQDLKYRKFPKCTNST